LGLPRFLFFEIGASAMFNYRCSEGIVSSNQVLPQAASAELTQYCNLSVVCCSIAKSNGEGSINFRGTIPFFWKTAVVKKVNARGT
jgi:hypothetical protein